MINTIAAILTGIAFTAAWNKFGVETAIIVFCAMALIDLKRPEAK